MRKTTLCISIAEEVKKLAKELSKEYFTSVSNIISRAVIEFNRKNEKDKKSDD